MFLYPRSFFTKMPFHTKKPFHTKIISISPCGPNQRRYVRHLQNRTIPLLLCEGPPKTGKTWFACAAAVQELRNGFVKQIVITHPTIESAHSRLIFNIFEDFYSGFDIHTMIQHGTLIISPLSMLARRRTLNNTFVISNDMQNSTSDQIRHLITCLGHNSRMVITGNTKQTGVKPNNSFSNTIAQIENDCVSQQDVSIIKLNELDVYSQSKIGNLYQPRHLKMVQSEHSPFSVFSKNRMR